MRKLFIATLTLGILAAPLAADAQQTGKVPRIGYLQVGGRIGSRDEAFLQGLRQLGYIEGKNIAIESRYAEGKTDRLPELAAELIRLKVDVIVTSAAGIAGAKKVTSTIPIVMANSGDPVGSGLVASLARPGGNVTGLTNLHPELDGKRLQLLKEAFPKAARVAVLWTPGVARRTVFTEMEAAAKLLGIKLQTLEVRGLDDFETAFERAKREGSQALFVTAGPLFTTHRDRIVGLAAKKAFPAMYPWTEFVEAGGLMSYGPNLLDMYRRAAYFVDKILKGAKPADLPVEQPTRFELVVNLKTAKALGLTIPQSVLFRADKVIQ